MTSFSLVVPTRNRAKLLDETIASILSLSNVERISEVVIVDNASTDDTASIVQAKMEAHRRIPLKYCHEPVPGLLAGRHRGLRETTGDVIVFLDDDVILDVEWFSGAQEAFASSDVVLSGGPSIPSRELPVWTRRFSRSTPAGGEMLCELSLIETDSIAVHDIDPWLVFGLNFAIRRTTLIDLGGFHPDCVPQELQLFQGDGETGLCRAVAKAKLRTVFSPRMRLRHQVRVDRLSIGYFQSRHFYQGVCDSYTDIRSALRDQGNFLEPSVSKTVASRFRSYLKTVAISMLDKCREIKNFTTGVHAAKCLFAYAKGVRYHRECALKSRILRNWIRRDHYFDYEYPQLEANFRHPKRVRFR